MKPDFEATAAVYKRIKLDWLPLWLRGRVTPMTLWVAVGVLGSSIAYVGKAQFKIDQHQESIDVLRQERNSDRALMEKISTQLEVMGNRMSNIADGLNQQRAWRDRIEDVAETSSRPRRRN